MISLVAMNHDFQNNSLWNAPENEDRGIEGAISSRDSGGDQLSEYDEDSSDSESDDVAVEESSALNHIYKTRNSVLFMLCPEKEEDRW